VSSRVATFAEAFSSIGWAGTAAVASVSLPLAIVPALLVLAALAAARSLSPRHPANA
jgi:ABC-2 type transport system permease protein